MDARLHQGGLLVLFPLLVKVPLAPVDPLCLVGLNLVHVDRIPDQQRLVVLLRGGHRGPGQPVEQLLHCHVPLPPKRGLRREPPVEFAHAASHRPRARTRVRVVRNGCPHRVRWHPPVGGQQAPRTDAEGPLARSRVVHRHLPHELLVLERLHVLGEGGLAVKLLQKGLGPRYQVPLRAGGGLAILNHDGVRPPTLAHPLGPLPASR
mmetsp:Transcript_3062/g.8356  ORF Transcript_3062/g.8356 Transcript_3062/m.8356 type:complete len:207 (+) Transcript_3062:2802-3422(+)